MSDAGVPGRGNGGGKTKVGFEQSFAYLGHYQPYGIYIPHGPVPYGVQMYYHGTGANFTSQINQRGMQRQFGENVDRLIVAEASVGKAIVMKRFHTRGRGRAAGIRKPFSHLTIVVRERAEAEEN